MKLKLSMLALGGLMLGAAITTTGCSDDDNPLVGDSIDPNDSVDATELSAPTAVKLTVNSETSATITATTANATDGAEGYSLISNNVVIADTALPAFTGNVSFEVTINKDSAATWSVAAYKSGKKSGATSVTFNPRTMTGPYTITKIISKVAGTGIDVDAGKEANVAADIAGSSYIDGDAGDVFFENTGSSAVTITPINGGKLVYLADGAMVSEDDLTEIKGITISTELTTKTLASGVVVYSNGKSPKDASDATLALAAGMEFLVVSATNSVSRVVIDAIAGDDVTSTVYLAADNDGVTLYKTK